MEPEYMVRDLEAKAEEMRQRSEQMQEQIQNASATASSKDGAVTVRVAPNGALQHIEFSPRATQLSHVQLGQIVMQVAAQAQGDAARQIADIVEPEFGDTEAMSFLTGFLPSQDDEQTQQSPSQQSSGQQPSGQQPSSSQPSNQQPSSSQPSSNQPPRSQDPGWDDDDNSSGSFLR